MFTFYIRLQESLPANRRAAILSSLMDVRPSTLIIDFQGSVDQNVAVQGTLRAGILFGGNACFITALVEKGWVQRGYASDFSK